MQIHSYFMESVEEEKWMCLERRMARSGRCYQLSDGNYLGMEIRDAQGSESTDGSRRENNSLTVWKRLQEGFVKINVDGAVDESTHTRAWGWVARDHYGNFLKARGVSEATSWSVVETEAMGVRDALMGSAEAGWSHVEVETDALSVVQGLKLKGGLLAFSLFLMIFGIY
ncbi:unnamed protein product [Cuscuta epithymum]|uniref:RNase H type-1 domain-containing protein n=1 Tax=Cuscuta epithymum TaxID=186058 RepID=A0AAV0C4E3_9ASTE|nr:unnamed protein product [Cuscuta epithymum]